MVPRTAPGLVISGQVVPAFTLLPAMSAIGSIDHAPSGPDVVEGFDRDGARLFSVHFTDTGYTYYLFAAVPPGVQARLFKLTVLIGKHSVSRTAGSHGAAAASAKRLKNGDVQFRWDARAFPRLACNGGPGSSPAPQMLDGQFTAANFFGNAATCDFSDGVKTVYPKVRIPIG